MNKKIGIIGGTGIQNALLLGETVQEVGVTTPYGEVRLFRGVLGGKEIYFLNRHGVGSACRYPILPHGINYRANIYAFHCLGVERIIATAAVGSLRSDFPPGSLGILGQFVDFTKGRLSSFYTGDGTAQGKFVNMTYPYCQEINERLREAGRQLGIGLTPDLVYICTEGPRFETAGEIAAFARLGGEVVGMTSATEAALCRELGVCYASIAMSMNWAAGVSGSEEGEIQCVDMVQFEEKLVALLQQVMSQLPEERQCDCFRWSQGV